jgi:hypothetical protein
VTSTGTASRDVVGVIFSPCLSREAIRDGSQRLSA